MTARLWRTSRRTALATAALLAGLAPACTPRAVAYRPDPEGPPAMAGEAHFTLAEVLVPSQATDLGVVVRVDATSEVVVTAAHVAPARAEACQADPSTGVIAAAVVSVDGQRQWQRPLRLRGSHLLTLEFPIATGERIEDGRWAPLETVDLAVTDASVLTGAPADDSRCVRLPLQSPGGRLQRRGGWSAGYSLRLDQSWVEGVSGVARLGRWLGPVRVGAELGAGARRCPNCPSPLYVSAPVALTIEAIVAARSGIGLGFELAYTARPMIGPDAGDRYLLFGPRLALRFVSAAPREGGLPGGPQQRYSSFDVLIARETAAGVNHWAATIVGVGWSWDRGF
jgi:hypothetical protein